MLGTLNQVCWTFVRGNFVYTLQQEISEKWDPVFPTTWITHKIGQRSKFIILSFSFRIDKQEIQGVFLTGTPPKNSKYKQVNLG